MNKEKPLAVVISREVLNESRSGERGKNGRWSMGPTFSVLTAFLLRSTADLSSFTAALSPSTTRIPPFHFITFSQWICRCYCEEFYKKICTENP
ncbi:hypothetical protein L2E82_39334 [Cichorium intybus]|uniref:Uncharacterized protein n=1 Tax=Cichorium intybus TaxID=13427 RepID=A0ACB9AIQ0_CICIN|nr:hypothetical protein L2E82_39334 [Cichorium intybus]